MTYHGHFEKGVVVFDEPVALPEGAKVRIEPIGPAGVAGPDGNRPSMFEHLREIIGSCGDLPADASENLEHYLYGDSKQS